MGEGDIADPARGYTSASYALSGKIMLSAIVILFTVVLLIICLHIYARCFLIRARRRNNTLRRRTHRRSTTHLVFISDTAPSQSLTSVNNNPVFISRGLEPDVLKSLPTFIYSSTANKTTAQGDQEEEEEVLECAVCLSEFEENEKGRLLPKCNHSFHIECIDMWFHTHSTCPICRAPVNNPQISEPEKTEIPSIQIVIDSSESEPTSSSSAEPCPSCQHEELIVNGVPSSSSSSSTSISTSSSVSSLNPLLSMGARRKISELVGVSIEVPRREESFREEIQSASPGSQGLKSPGSRILSLKRILSREKKPSIPSLSFCGSVSEIDPEKGVEVEEEEAQSPAVQVNRLSR